MLIKCIECNNSVSSRASACPKCGHPLNAEQIAHKSFESDLPKKKTPYTRFIYSMIFLFILLNIGLIVLINPQKLYNGFIDVMDITVKTIWFNPDTTTSSALVSEIASEFRGGLSENCEPQKNLLSQKSLGLELYCVFNTADILLAQEQIDKIMIDNKALATDDWTLNQSNSFSKGFKVPFKETLGLMIITINESYVLISVSNNVEVY